MRKFIRHPSGIPLAIAVNPPERGLLPRTPLRNISQGGLCFTAPQPLSEGISVTLGIDVCRPPFHAIATVVWCRKVSEGFDVGVKFEDPVTEYSVRMVEQICHIEQYRKDIRQREGRELTSQQAAEEWIASNAKNFPR